MENNLVLNGPYTNKDFFNFITTSALPRHNWYYFKEGFSTGLVNEAINSSNIKNRPLSILDPFSGSGTTALTSALLGHTATGFEVNPFLHFTSIIKTTAWNLDRKYLIEKLAEIINLSKGGAFSPLEGFSTFTAKEGLEKWLFNTSVIRRYTAVIEAIDTCLLERYRPIFKFSALIAATNCSNVKKDGKGVRYIKNWESLSFSGSDFEYQLKKIILMILDDNEKAPIDKKNQPIITLSDSRSAFKTTKIEKDEYDLVITSPPYLNSFDYTDIYRPELFLGGFVKDNHELKSLRMQTIRSHVQVEWNRDISYISSFLEPFFEKVVNSKEVLWNKNIPLMIKAYFDDLYTILSDIKPRLRKNGEIWLVVSTSAYAGVHIPVDLILGEIGHELGFKLQGVHCLRYLRTSSQQYGQLNAKKAPLRESLIIFKKHKLIKPSCCPKFFGFGLFSL